MSSECESEVDKYLIHPCERKQDDRCNNKEEEAFDILVWCQISSLVQITCYVVSHARVYRCF